MNTYVTCLNDNNNEFQVFILGDPNQSIYNSKTQMIETLNMLVVFHFNNYNWEECYLNFSFRAKSKEQNICVFKKE